MPQYCLVKHNIVSAVIDGSDVGNEPDTLPISGDVTFYPILDRGDSVVVTAGAEKIAYVLDPISARIVNGKISVDGEEGVKLFAGGPDSNPDRIRYRARFTGLNIAGSKSIDLKDVLFEAVPGGEMELSMAQPVPGAPYPGYSATIEQGIAQIEGARNEALGQVTDAVNAEVAAISYRRGVIAPGTDWNTVTDEGAWERPATPTTADPNQPSGNIGTLIVGKPDRAAGRLALTQLFIGAQGDGMWHRARSAGGTWLGWKQVADYQNINPRLQTLTDGVAAATAVTEATRRPTQINLNTDLDTLITPIDRRFNVTASSTSNPDLHYPPGAVHGFIDIMSLGGFLPVQVWTEIFADKGIAIRRRIGGQWLAWKWIGGTGGGDLTSLIDRVAALESAAFDTQVEVAPGSRSLVGGPRPRTWLTPDTDIYWTGATGQEFFPAGYTGEGQVGTMGKKTTYSDMSVTKLSAGGLLEIVCSDPATGECIIIALDRTTAGQYRDDFEIFRAIHAGHIVGGVAQKEAELSPVSNMEIAFNIIVDGKGEFFPWHGTRAAVAATPSVITDGNGASLGLSALPVGGTVTGVNGVVLTQSCYGRHTYTGEKNWVRVDQVTTITPDGLIQSETVVTALDDVALGISYGPMTPINRQHFTTMQVLGGAEYPVPQTPATVDTMTPITEGADATSVLFTGPEYFGAATILAPESTWAQDLPGVELGVMRLQDRANDPLVKLYPMVFTQKTDLPVGTQWRLGGQWRFGHLAG